ncbi:hypothetical protein OAG85_02375 [Verrucomicrobiales bacterium]|nr:hypothetical protein [Verrucomicrobiales bacterium]
MNRFRLLAALLCLPIFLLTSLSANEKKAAVQSKKPSLSYYYFDG